MKKVMLYGASGSLGPISDILRTDDGVKVIGIIDDDDSLTGKQMYGWPVLGNRSYLLESREQVDEIVLAIGSVRNTNARTKIFAALKAQGFSFRSVIAPSAVISPQAQIGEAVIVMQGVIINYGAVLADNAFCNTGSIIEHDCKIGASSFICPGVVLAGGSVVGESTFIGSGTVTASFVKIGNECVIGAGSVVIQDIADKKRAFGSPAHKYISDL